MKGALLHEGRAKNQARAENTQPEGWPPTRGRAGGVGNSLSQSGTPATFIVHILGEEGGEGAAG